MAEILGTLIKKQNVVTGTTQAGNEWKKQEIVIDQQSDFKPEVVVTFWNDKIKQIDKLELGTFVQCSVNLSSREFNGRYYHNIEGWWLSDQSNNPEANKKIQEQPEEENKDLPF